MLLSIAVIPLVREDWWESNNNKLLVSGILGIPTLAYLLIIGRSHDVVHTLVFEYIPFIILLGSLFVVSGGIKLSGDLRATPLNNAIFLFTGATLASFIGTTGAAMLLIRPLLRTNSERKYVVHTVIFFIFMVANIGGCLTPLGDPPLFLGYLKGVPFTWTFKLWPYWFAVNLTLLTIYFVWDTMAYQKEKSKDFRMDKMAIEPLRLEGKINFVWLLGIVVCVAFLNANYIPAIHENHYIGFVREIAMLILVGLSIITTRPGLRKENEFTMNPIIEVAYLFIGIFITMIPALILLKTRGAELGVEQPWHFFWSAGAFTSFLDNAPTYVTFLSLAEGVLYVNGVAGILSSIQGQTILVAISLGAVFMGANTYIGNAPNFMVKAVAEEQGVNMPSFLGYMKYSVGILIPIFVVFTLIVF